MLGVSLLFGAGAVRGQDYFHPAPVPALPGERIEITPELFYGPADWTLHFLPRGFLYSTYWASSAEPSLGVRVIHERNLGTLVDSSIGGRVGFLRFGPRDRLEGWQLDLVAGVNLRQSAREGLDLQAADFRFDIPLTYRLGPHGWKFGYYHVSSHVGDQFLLKNPGFERVNFIRDAFVLGYSYYVIPEMRLYAETGWGFNTDVSRPWEFQFGLDYGPVRPTGIHGSPFIALNGHLRQELSFGGNFALQAGWAWRGRGLNAGTLRTGLFYYDGGSPQFSFFANHERQIGWGLWYDF
jgi:hypothetical protein